MNIWAYFDESGTHKGSPAFSIAGFLGKAENWGAFQFEWGKALEDFGLDFFHMASFESRRKGYERPNDVRQERINRLLAIVRKYALASVGVVFPLVEYDETFPDDGIPTGPAPEWLAPGIHAPTANRPGDPPPNLDVRPGDARRKSGGPYGLAFSMLIQTVAEIVIPLSGNPTSPTSWSRARKAWVRS